MWERGSEDEVEDISGDKINPEPRHIDTRDLDLSACLGTDFPTSEGALFPSSSQRHRGIQSHRLGMNTVTFHVPDFPFGESH